MHNYRCRARIFAVMTEDALREAVEKNPGNGSYADSICKNCGSFQFSEDGSPATAKLTDQCNDCPRNEGNELLVGAEKFEILREISLTGV